MRIVFDSILGGVMAAAVTGAAWAQSAAPSSPPASAAAPANAASKPAPRNPAITAAENAKEPGNQRPEERVVPQISIPLKTRNSSAAATATASAPIGSVPGRVNEGAARCLALGGAEEKAACERRLAASAPVKAER
ncbi:MAG: hypothetical protein JF607_01970 [Burkholderiales bacterium]|jgi:hypothetical protein|nr:hypothetical protein [Burkholderiales bacterium]